MCSHEKEGVILKHLKHVDSSDTTSWLPGIQVTSSVVVWLERRWGGRGRDAERETGEGRRTETERETQRYRERPRDTERETDAERHTETEIDTETD